MNVMAFLLFFLNVVDWPSGSPLQEELLLLPVLLSYSNRFMINLTALHFTDVLVL